MICSLRSVVSGLFLNYNNSMSELTAQSYQKLVHSIDQEFQRGIFEVKKQLERQRLETYWNVGRDIHRYIEISQIQENERKKFFTQLSKDLNRDNYFLKQLCAFFIAYPQIPEKKGISWSHYRELLLISTKREREKWERRIIKDRIPCKDFSDILHEDILKPGRDDAGLQSQGVLTVVRGNLYIYRMVSPNEVPWSTDSVVVDLGFGIRREVMADASSSLAVGHRVVSYKNNAEYEIKRTDISSKSMYTYRAVVERVIDGDTIIANIDCGFQCWSHQRLRLRGINTPELSESGGVSAQRFVRRALKSCEWIIVKTYLDRKDAYGRYLADIFFDADGLAYGNPQYVADKGRYLNQLLIDEGHANIYGSS